MPARIVHATWEDRGQSLEVYAARCAELDLPLIVAGNLTLTVGTVFDYGSQRAVIVRLVPREEGCRQARLMGIPPSGKDWQHYELRAD